uniref:NADH dehydrogenase [ubiquinone] flavoprotein 3, mitochondrial n=2 Tax=Esox lucius TaxID=8010 RepID=A0A3P8YK40_ESOLU
MATSLLRLGHLKHLKVLQRDGWGLFKSSAAPFCTKAQEPTKAVKKAKAATLEVSEERAALLAYKTAVAFPVKPLASGLSSAQALVNVEPVASPATAETIVTAKDVDPAPFTTSNIEALTAETGMAVEIVSPAPDIAAAAVEAAKSASSTATEAVARETIHVEAFAAKAPSVAGAVAPPAPVTDVAAAIVESAPPLINAAPPIAKPDVAAGVTEGILAAAGPPEKSSSASTDPGDQSADSSSSSDSESDSESDSDSDDEKSEVESKTTSEVVETKKVSSEAESGKVATAPLESTLGGTAEAMQEVTPAASLDTVSEAMKEEAAPKHGAQDVQRSTPVITGVELVDPAPVLDPGLAGAVASSEELRDSAPEIVVTPVEVVPEAAVEDAPGAPVAAAEVATEAAVVEVATGVRLDAMEEPPEFEAAAGPAQAVAEAAPVEAAAEELLDTAPVMAEAAGEEMITQPPAEAESMEASEETAAEPPVPAPEPFDNTTYKNLQHHNYNHYTFADMDLEMAKYRLPQPSSGRPSPRH